QVQTPTPLPLESVHEVEQSLRKKQPEFRKYFKSFVGGTSVIVALLMAALLWQQTGEPGLHTGVKGTNTTQSTGSEKTVLATNNADINAGKGKLTASNVIYSINAGSNITITGDKQNPTISADVTAGVSSLQGATGAVVLTEGSGISIAGTTITNTDTGTAQNI